MEDENDLRYAEALGPPGVEVSSTHAALEISTVAAQQLDELGFEHRPDMSAVRDRQVERLAIERLRVEEGACGGGGRYG